jgi:hypothetical protein
MASMQQIGMANLNGGGIAYEDRSLATLRKNLENIAKTYNKEDYYFLLGENSESINFFIKNTGSAYLKDVKLIMQIPKYGDFIVAQTLPVKPGKNILNANFGYPAVENLDDFFEISENLGDVRQHLNTPAFKEPLRIFFSRRSAGLKLDLKLFFYAQNLDVPIEQTISIRVVQLKENNEVLSS